MDTSNRRRPTWILTVAAAYAVFPACGDDTSNADRSSDGGVDAALPDSIDAGLVAHPPVGRLPDGAVVHPTEHCVSITDAGPVVRTRDTGVMGLTIAPPSKDGVIGFAVLPCDDTAVDAATPATDAGPFNVGLVARSVKGP